MNFVRKCIVADSTCVDVYEASVHIREMVYYNNAVYLLPSDWTAIVRYDTSSDVATTYADTSSLDTTDGGLVGMCVDGSTGVMYILSKTSTTSTANQYTLYHYDVNTATFIRVLDFLNGNSFSGGVNGMVAGIQAGNSVLYISSPSLLYRVDIDTATILTLKSYSAAARWFRCEDSLIKDIPDDTVDRLLACPLNGIAWSVASRYGGTDVSSVEVNFFTTEEANAYIVNDSRTKYCSEADYDVICNDMVGFMPPYSCTKNSNLSFFLVLSTAIANSELVMLFLLLVGGFVLQKVSGNMMKGDQQKGGGGDGSDGKGGGRSGVALRTHKVSVHPVNSTSTNWSGAGGEGGKNDNTITHMLPCDQIRAFEEQMRTMQVQMQALTEGVKVDQAKTQQEGV